MSKNLSNNTKLLVVSDSGMFAVGSEVYAFGPVVKELQEMLKIFTAITWIGFNSKDQINNASYIKVSSEIKTILLERVGGKSIIDKVSILKSYPKMYRIINSEIKTHNYIHSRAPSNPAYIAMLLSKKYTQKKFWFKYAGDWTGEASSFYNFQRKKLKTLKDHCIITVNGQWRNQSQNIIAFENPCLDEKDRFDGKLVVSEKKLADKINFCFVGGLNKNKGIDKIMEAFKNISSDKIGTFHVVGDGKLKLALKQDVKNITAKVVFHGALPKSDVQEIYKKSHFIILPSQSEGFPKVIGEAMNYGCIPIVSDVSCIGQYIKNKQNGFLIKSITIKEIIKSIQKSVRLTNEEFIIYIDNNYRLADKFTYNYYIERLQKEIFPSH